MRGKLVHHHHCHHISIDSLHHYHHISIVSLLYHHHHVSIVSLRHHYHHHHISTIFTPPIVLLLRRSQARHRPKNQPQAKKAKLK